MQTVAEYKQAVRQTMTAIKPSLNREFTDNDIEECMHLVGETLKIQSVMGTWTEIPNPMVLAMKVIEMQIKDRPYKTEMKTVKAAIDGGA